MMMDQGCNGMDVDQGYNGTAIEQLIKNTMVPLDIPRWEEDWDDEIDTNPNFISGTEERGISDCNSIDRRIARKRKREEQLMNPPQEKFKNEEKQSWFSATQVRSYVCNNTDAFSMASFNYTFSTFNTANDTSRKFVGCILPANGSAFGHM